MHLMKAAAVVAGAVTALIVGARLADVRPPVPSGPPSLPAPPVPPAPPWLPELDDALVAVLDDPVVDVEPVVVELLDEELPVEPPPVPAEPALSVAASSPEHAAATMVERKTNSPIPRPQALMARPF